MAAERQSLAGLRGALKPVLAAAWAVAAVLLAAGPVRGQELVVRIGHVAPTTGQQALLGKSSESGARMAIEELNGKKVTIGGRKARFELLAEDEAAEAKPGSPAAVARLIDARVRAVIGHTSPEGAVAAARSYGEAGIAQISPTVTAARLTRQGLKTTFRLIAEDTRIGSTLGKYAVGQLQGKAVAVFDDRSADGQAQAEAFEQAVRAAGGRVVARSSVSDKTGELGAAVAALRPRKPDVVFFGGTDVVAGALLRQFKQASMEARLLGGPGMCTGELPKLAAGAMTDGQVVCAQAGGVQGTSGKAMDDFLAAYRKRFEADAQMQAPYAYDAVYVLVAAMVQAGSADPAKFLPALARTDGYKGVTGTISFDAKGDLKDGAITLYAYTGGRRDQIAVVR